MEKAYLILTQDKTTYSVKKKKFMGTDYLIVPVVMMVEGVHNGSRGPLLHKVAEFGRFVESWNGIPIVIDHPVLNGEAISANSPEITENGTVGRVYNTKISGNKLKAEAWLEEDRLRQVSVDVYTAIKASAPMEVSAGVFSDEEDEGGEFNGEEYSAIATNHRPDHLALLPGGVGACSLEDGCGIRNNKKKGVKNEMTRKRADKLENDESDQKQTYEPIIIDNTTDGMIERLEAVRRKIDNMDTNDTYHFLHEVYDDAVIYESRLRVGESKIYKQNYSFDSGVVELVGDPVEVLRKVEYTPIKVNNKFIRKRKKLEVNMSKENDCPKCLEKVDALIANKQSKFTEDDREWLLTQNEATLDKLSPTIVEKEKEKIVEKTIDVNKLAPEDQAALNYGKKQLKIRRDKMTESIQANSPKETWTDDILNSMDIDTLERVFKSIQKEDVTDYSLQDIGNRGEYQINKDIPEPMILGQDEPKEKGKE